MINESSDEGHNSNISKRPLLVNMKPVMKRPFASKSTSARAGPLARRSTITTNNGNKEKPYLMVQRVKSID